MTPEVAAEGGLMLERRKAQIRLSLDICKETSEPELPPHAPFDKPERQTRERHRACVRYEAWRARQR